MKTKTIGITYTRKFNLGNYESLEISAFMCGEPDEGEDPQAVALLLGEEAKEAVYNAAQEELKATRYKPAIKRFFVGKEIIKQPVYAVNFEDFDSDEDNDDTPF
jgi:hypothetical protein